MALHNKVIEEILETQNFLKNQKHTDEELHTKVDQLILSLNEISRTDFTTEIDKYFNSYEFVEVLKNYFDFRYEPENMMQERREQIDKMNDLLDEFENKEKADEMEARHAENVAKLTAHVKKCSQERRLWKGVFIVTVLVSFSFFSHHIYLQKFQSKSEDQLTNLLFFNAGIDSTGYYRDQVYRYLDNSQFRKNANRIAKLEKTKILKEIDARGTLLQKEIEKRNLILDK